MRRWVMVSLVLILALGLVATACGGGSSTTTTAAGGATTTSAGGATTTSAAGGGGGAQVTIQNFSFSPASVTVKVGDTVTWTNQDSSTHTVVADNGEFKSGNLGNGATFSFTFSAAGTFAYHCSIHSTMKGTVVVQ